MSEEKSLKNPIIEWDTASDITNKLSKDGTDYMLQRLKMNDNNVINIKALENEDTLLRTHCYRHKCCPVCPRAQNLLRTQILCPGHKKMFLILFRNILCPQQMFPSLRSPRNIMDNNVSATMCPHSPLPLR